jgi:hypothetical protein
MIGSYSKSSCIRTVLISKYVTDHKLLEDVHEDSLQIPHLRYFVAHKHTLGYLEVIILFFTFQH